MRVISNKSLRAFSSVYPDSHTALQSWRKLVEESTFLNFTQIKKTFAATDKVGEYFVFNIGGNKYRLIAKIQFTQQLLFVRHVFTHKEYDKWKP